jgi:methionyl-tRNA formyltransferase
MRIVVHGQQAFGKAALEALIKRGENVVGVYVARKGRVPRPSRSRRRRLPPSCAYRPDSHKKPAVWDDVFDCLGELADPGPTTFRCW